MISEYIVISVALFHSLKILDIKPIVAIKLVSPIQILLLCKDQIGTSEIR